MCQQHSRVREKLLYADEHLRSMSDLIVSGPGIERLLTYLSLHITLCDVGLSLDMMMFEHGKK